MTSCVAPDLETVTAVYDELDAAFDKALALTYDAVPDSELLKLSERMERNVRRAPAVSHRILTRLVDEDDEVP